MLLITEITPLPYGSEANYPTEAEEQARAKETHFGFYISELLLSVCFFSNAESSFDSFQRPLCVV
jgi:hypothetical protein